MFIQRTFSISRSIVLFPLSLSLSVLLPSQARPSSSSSSSIRFDAPLRHSPPPVRRPPLLLPLRALLSEPERKVEMKMVGESEGGGGRSGRPPAQPRPPLLVAAAPFAGSGDDLLSIPLFQCWAGTGACGGWSGCCSGEHDGDESCRGWRWWAR